MMTEIQKTERARRRVEAMTGFYVHTTVYIAVLAGLTLLNWMSGEVWWVQWVFAGWGLGLVLHWALVFGGLGERVTTWQLRKMYRLRSQM